MNPGQNYEKLLKLIKAYPYWARLGGSSYLILSDNTPVQIRDYLRSALDANDRLYVGKIVAPAAWWNLPNDVSEWILQKVK